MIELACTSDGGYAPHTGAMLHSVFSADPQQRFRVHVLHATLAEADRERLRQVAEPFGAELNFLPAAPGLRDAFPNRHFHASCWYRILLPELLPDVARILYLDSDLIVCDGLAPLWRTQLGSHPLAAVINPFYPFDPDYPVSHVGLAPGSPYYNSGVLLMDLEALRANRFGERIRDYAARHPDNLFPEQDALNALYQDDCLPLHPRWNAQSTVFELRDAELPFSVEQLEQARRDPAVVHFIGPYKPWRYLCTHPLRHLYWQHRRQTPWPPEPLAGRSAKNWLLRRLPVNWRFRWQKAENRLRQALKPRTGARIAPPT